MSKNDVDKKYSNRVMCVTRTLNMINTGIEEVDKELEDFFSRQVDVIDDFIQKIMIDFNDYKTELLRYEFTKRSIKGVIDKK